MAICNKTTTTNIVNNPTEETTETELTEEKQQREKMIRKGKCSEYRSFKPNTIDIQSENLGIIPDINSNKNINKCINAIQHDKPYNKTVENYRNIVEGFELPDVKIPDVDMPDVKIPDVDMPDVKIPGVDMPDVNMPDVDQGVIDGVKNILFLIVAGLISVFVFALFIFGPFVFWSMHAPNKMYSEGNNECYKDFTILERFFPFKKDSVPYNWKIAKQNNWCYPKKEKQTSISIDTCMNNKINIYGTGKVHYITTYLESLLKGFPYNLIMPDKDQYYSKYVGGFLLFIALLISTYIFLMIYIFKGNFLSGDGRLITMAVFIGMILTAVVSFFTTFLTIKYHMKDGNMDIDMPWKHLGVLASIPLIGNVIGGFENDGNNLGVITASIAAVLVFMIFSSISGINNFKKPRNDGKDFTFAKLPGKMLHFIRKCIVNGYIENIKCYRKTFYSGFNIISNFFNNHLPKPIFTILFVFFGSLIIPIIFVFIYIIASLRSLWCGCLGMFKRNSSNSKKQESSNSENKESRNDPPTGGSKILSKIKQKISNLKIQRPKINVQITAWVLTLLFINPILNLIYTTFNGLLTFLTYTIVPFFYPDIIASIFKCNVKFLIIVFGLGILSTLWYYQDKKNGINFGLTNDILAWMTVTFVVISFFTITS